MIRLSEVVLAGHPDKLCDAVADAVVDACVGHEPEAYAQVEVAAWGDEIWLNGGIASERPLPFSIEEIVHAVTARVGCVRRYRVHDAVCREITDPRQWTRKVNDQSIVVGWAGYDERTKYLPPEHFLAHQFRIALEEAIRGECVWGWRAGILAADSWPALPPGDSAPLRGEGPDGKLLVRVREEGSRWRLEQLVATVQQRATTPFVDFVAALEGVLRGAYERVRLSDRRWCAAWEDVHLLLNPNGPLLNGGSDGDNGQTGRKLVMDFYGPRVPIGGGALAGKHPTHIDRIGACAARQAAVHAVRTGARECRVTAAWAPNEPAPLEVVFEMEGRGERKPAEFFDHEAMRERWLNGDAFDRVHCGSIPGCGADIGSPSAIAQLLRGIC